jgi:hypothetical protein
MSSRARNILLSSFCFLIPFSIYFITQSSSLMFDDASEFATVIKQGSNAHPPGFPSYVFLAMVWDKILSLFSHHTVFILNLFSITVSSFASLLFYKTIRTILNHTKKNNSSSVKNDFIAGATALCFATELTTWTWSNTIEVYAFQAFAMSLMLFGLVYFHVTGKKIFITLASLGFAFGLSNHHLTVILFAPFIPFFFFPDLFLYKENGRSDKKKKVKTAKKSWALDYVAVFRTKPFWMMVCITTAITVGFYFWMYLRAQHDYPFMFGKPDSMHELIYHVTGGSYSKNIEETSKNILQSRIPYFFQLTFFQFLFFLPLVIAGLITMIRKKMARFFSVVIFYFLLLLTYQVNNNQWENTDAYMLLPFMVLTIPVAFGAMNFFESWKLKYILPVAIILQIVINFPKCNRRDYNISESMMHQLDISAPKNSIVIIADWSLLMQYYYSRIVDHFRPDLVVLHEDIKFNHYRVIQTLYPEFYQSIKPEFDRFIDELSKEHPEQVTNTGCDLSTPKLMNVFQELIKKIEAVAAEQNRPLLTDPRAHYFMVQQGFYSPNRFVSGCFVSSVKTNNNDEFLNFDMKWLRSPMLQNDLTALNKMVDYQAMFDNHIAYYTGAHDEVRLAKAQAGKEKVMKIQRDLKKNISFAYKLK